MLEAGIQVEGSRVVEIRIGLSFQEGEGRMYRKDNQGLQDGSIRNSEMSWMRLLRPKKWVQGRAGFYNSTKDRAGQVGLEDIIDLS